VTKGPRIPVGIWPEVVAGAKRKGLRRVAREYAVSHETVRAIVRKVEKGIAQRLAVWTGFSFGRRKRGQGSAPVPQPQHLPMTSLGPHPGPLETCWQLDGSGE
jgi:hypothetical protein